MHTNYGARTDSRLPGGGEHERPAETIYYATANVMATGPCHWPGAGLHGLPKGVGDRFDARRKEKSNSGRRSSICSAMSQATGERILTMPAKLASAPPFPAVAIKLLSLLEDEGSDFASIADWIATDPVLAGQLIRRANAADQARYCEARNVFQAVAGLGMEGTREVTLAIAMAGYANSALKVEILRPCWHHTLACALVAAEIARQCGLPPAELYTAALLHDIGRIGLLSAYPAEYGEIMAGAEGQADDLLTMERERFGVDHVEAGLWLARKWKLPESIVEVVGRHHEKATGAMNQVMAVQIACRLADFLGFSVNRPATAPDLDEIVELLPQWTRARFRTLIPILRKTIVKEIQLYDSSEAPPSETTEDGAEPEEGATAQGPSPDAAKATASPARRSYFMWFAVLAAIVLVLGVAFLFLWR